MRNLREEAAVSAELEMVKRALQNDEQEAFALLDHVRKGEERLAELEAAFAEASELVEPRRDELIAKKDAARRNWPRSERSARALLVASRLLNSRCTTRFGGTVVRRSLNSPTTALAETASAWSRCRSRTRSGTVRPLSDARRVA